MLSTKNCLGIIGHEWDRGGGERNEQFFAFLKFLVDEINSNDDPHIDIFAQNIILGVFPPIPPFLKKNNR